MAPPLHDLEVLGLKVASLADLSREEDAVPALLRWLPLTTCPRAKVVIVRALSVPFAKPAAAPLLIAEFLRTSDEQAGLKWAIGNALEVVADDSVFNDVVALVKNKRHGKAREMLTLALGKRTGTSRIGPGRWPPRVRGPMPPPPTFTPEQVEALMDAGAKLVQWTIDSSQVLRWLLDTALGPLHAQAHLLGEHGTQVTSKTVAPSRPAGDGTATERPVSVLHRSGSPGRKKNCAPRSQHSEQPPPWGLIARPRSPSRSRGSLSRSRRSGSPRHGPSVGWPEAGYDHTIHHTKGPHGPRWARAIPRARGGAVAT